MQERKITMQKTKRKTIQHRKLPSWRNTGLLLPTSGGSNNLLPMSL
jgi:hypothetical protein